MFGLMKNAGKETAGFPEAAKLTELEKGYGVGFGFMPQKNISGKRMPVTAISSYLFDSDNFTTYRLENDSADVNLIIAEDDEPSAAYLALSQRIEPRLYDALFSTLAPQNWFALRKGDAVAVNAEALSAPQGWLTAKYKMVLSAQGRFMEGDYRQSEQAELIRQSRPCDYVLLVDEDFSCALEAEKYRDGTMNVFATVYRPSTDIGEITRSPKVAPGPLVGLHKSELPKPLAYSIEKIAHVSPAESTAANAQLQDYKALSGKAGASAGLSSLPGHANENNQSSPRAIAEASDLQQAYQALQARAPEQEHEVPLSVTEIKQTHGELAMFENADPMAASHEEEREMEIALSEDNPAPVDKPQAPVAISTAPVRQAEAYDENPAYDHMLACDIPLAARLISEAQLNKMSISDLIRKVVDLPRALNDKILIPFALNPAEVTELAARYQVLPDDIAVIKAHILDDLHRFAGQKD